MRIIQENDLLELKNDLVFQEVFGKQKNSKITGHLLSLILERKVSNVNLDLNKRMLGNRIDSKTGRLDIRAKFNDGEDCNIELQVSSYEYMEKRMLEYWAGMYTQKISSGDDYGTLKPSISILIADYKIKGLEDIENYHTVWNLRERKNLNKIITKDIELHILEIPKIKNTKIGKDELALWLKFIENPLNEEVQKNMKEKENKLLKQAEEELAYLSGDPDFKRLVDARVGFLRDQNTFEAVGKEKGYKQGRVDGHIEGKEEGRKEGKAEGIALGKEQEKAKNKAKLQEIAKKLLKLKMPIEQIMEITELTEEEIKKIEIDKN